MKDFFKKLAAKLSSLWHDTPADKQPFFESTLYPASPHVSHHEHVPGYANASDTSLAEADEDYVTPLTSRQLYDRQRYQQNREQIVEAQRQRRAKKKEAAAQLLSKEDAEDEAFALLAKWQKQREASKRYYDKKMAAKGRKTTKLNLGVPRRTPTGDWNPAYMQAYYSQAKATGNTRTTFTGPTTGYGYGTSPQ